MCFLLPLRLEMVQVHIPTYLLTQPGVLRCYFIALKSGFQGHIRIFVFLSITRLLKLNVANSGTIKE